MPVGVVAGGAESVNWMGDVTYVDFDFDPEGVVGLAKGGDKGGGDGDGDGGGDGDGDGGGDGDGDGGGAAALSAPVDIIGELEVNVEVEDLKARLRAAGKRRGGGAFGGIGLSGGSGGRGRAGRRTLRARMPFRAPWPYRSFLGQHLRQVSRSCIAPTPRSRPSSSRRGGGGRLCA